MKSVTLTEAQKQLFWQQGYLVLDEQPLLEEARVLELHQRFVSCFRGDFSTKRYPDEWHWREGISQPNAVREICNAWKSDHQIQSVVLSEELGHLAGQLFEHWDSARVAQDDLVWKVPAGRSSAEELGNDSTRQVGYHVDGDYISKQFTNSEQANSITIWIALDDADADNGVVEYISGSHRLPQELLAEASQSFHADAAHQGEDTGSEAKTEVAPSVDSCKDEVRGRLAQRLRQLDPDGQLLKDGWPSLELAQPRIPKGCCVVHHQSTLHGSRANRATDRHRRALVVHLIDGASHFVQDPGYIYGRYKLRDTDELREEFFPTVWRRKIAEA